MRKKIIVSLILGFLVWLGSVSILCSIASCKFESANKLGAISVMLGFMFGSFVIIVVIPKLCAYLFRLQESILCFPYFVITALLFTESYFSRANLFITVALVVVFSLPGIVITIFMNLTRFVDNYAVKSGAIFLFMFLAYWQFVLIFTPNILYTFQVIGTYIVSATAGWYILTALKGRLLNA